MQDGMINDMSRESDQRRARARSRAFYPGEVVKVGDPKPALYAGLNPVERLSRMSALCRAQWIAAFGSIERPPRAQWPGEIFVIERG